MAASQSTLHDYPNRYFAAWGQRDLEVALDVVAETLDWQDPSLPEPLTSREGAAVFFQGAWAAFPDIRFDMVGAPLVDVDNASVACEWVMLGTHTGDGFPPGVSASGNAFAVTGCDVWHLDDDGRATRVRAFYDGASFARQLGLA
ncbi:MAG: hypothetical protein JWM84_1906 [Nocardioides sp.]|nr:hypothetical protein [Nocardioides sp.]